MVTVFKNLTNIMIVLGEWSLYGQVPHWGVLLSLLVMCIGAAFAAHHDLMFSAVGYFCMLLNCIASAGYALYMRKVTRAVALSRFSAVFFNNAGSLLILCLVALTSGELREVSRSLLQDPFDQRTTVLYLVSGSVAFLLNFASLWCVAVTSATTYAVIGSLNKVPVAILGHLLFRTHISFEGGISIVVNMIGGFMYSYSKIVERGKQVLRSCPPGHHNHRKT